MGDVPSYITVNTEVQTMNALRWHGRQDVRLDEIPVPKEIPMNWSLIEVVACGICATDMEEYLHGPIVSPITPHPLTGAQVPVTMGHEVVGKVIESRGADGIAPGTLVIVEGNRHCGNCFWCREGNYPLCVMLGSLGQMGNGGLAEYMLAPSYMCLPLPEQIGPREATLIEPLSVIVRALRRKTDATNDSLAIFGAGTLGLLAVQAARARGAQDVIVIDPDRNRREIATQLGADLALGPEDLAMIASRYEAGGPSWALECAGSTNAAESALAVVRNGGTAVLVGVHDAPIELNMLKFVLEERTLTSSVSHVWNEDFPEAIELLKQGYIETKPLLTSVVPLSKTVELGFEALAHNDGQEIKIVVVPDRYYSDD